MQTYVKYFDNNMQTYDNNSLQTYVRYFDNNTLANEFEIKDGMSVFLI